MSDDVRIAELKTECTLLMHAMQSGVAAYMHHHPTETEPKQLRVGINSALVQNSALATLLIRKGVITDLEYWETQAELWRNEVIGYEKLLTNALGAEVKLH